MELTAKEHTKIRISGGQFQVQYVAGSPPRSVASIRLQTELRTPATCPQCQRCEVPTVTPKTKLGNEGEYQDVAKFTPRQREEKDCRTNLDSQNGVRLASLPPGVRPLSSCCPVRQITKVYIVNPKVKPSVHPKFRAKIPPTIKDECKSDQQSSANASSGGNSVETDKDGSLGVDEVSRQIDQPLPDLFCRESGSVLSDSADEGNGNCVEENRLACKDEEGDEGRRVRRQKANRRERTRIRRLQMGFRVLGDIIPPNLARSPISGNRSLSKISVLRGAIEYLRYLWAVLGITPQGGRGALLWDDLSGDSGCVECLCQDSPDSLLHHDPFVTNNDEFLFAKDLLLEEELSIGLE